MRLHQRGVIIGILALGILTIAGAAPDTPTYFGVTRAIESIRADWEQHGETGTPNSVRWEKFFDALVGGLDEYAAATSENERLEALGKVHRLAVELNSLDWPRGTELRADLDAWLGPRVRLAKAQRNLQDAVRSLPATADSETRTNRERWGRFLEEELGAALREYESANLVRDRRAAVWRVYGALNTLDARNRAYAWPPAIALQEALDELINGPNLDAKADVEGLRPRLAKEIVETGPVEHEGQVAWVTAGPYLGFGLLPSDDGLAFLNAQALTSVSNIRGFHEQVAEDRRGRLAARMYYFGATTHDAGTLTMIAILRPCGLQLVPSNTHNIGAAISSVPIAGRHLSRSLASMLGLNQERITQGVYKGAIGQIVEGIYEGSAEETAKRTAEAQEKQNAELAAYLIGWETLKVRNLAVAGLDLRSRPDHAIIGGNVQWFGAAEQIGADRPEPYSFRNLQPGVNADVHLPAVMTNLSRGYLQSPAAARVKNLMIVTRKVPPGAPLKEGFVLTENVDFPTFARSVETAVAADDPRLTAIRIKRPGQLPEFAADRHGHLVALVHEMAIEVPVPRALRRDNARIYRIEAPSVEFEIEFQIEPARDPKPIRLTGKVVHVDLGSGVRVYTIAEDESKAKRLNNFAARNILRSFDNRLEGMPIDIPFSELNLPEYALKSASALDPSGWIRFILTPTGRPPVTAEEAAPSVP